MAATLHTASQAVAAYFPTLFKCPILPFSRNRVVLHWASLGTNPGAVKADLENSMLKQPDTESRPFHPGPILNG